MTVAPDPTAPSGDARPTDEDREALLAEALSIYGDVTVVGWRERTPVTVDGVLARNSRHDLAAALLPVVDKIVAAEVEQVKARVLAVPAVGTLHNDPVVTLRDIRAAVKEKP